MDFLEKLHTLRIFFVLIWNRSCYVVEFPSEGVILLKVFTVNFFNWCLLFYISFFIGRVTHILVAQNKAIIARAKVWRGETHVIHHADHADFQTLITKKRSNDAKGGVWRYKVSLSKEEQGWSWKKIQWLWTPLIQLIWKRELSWRGLVVTNKEVPLLLWM